MSRLASALRQVLGQEIAPEDLVPLLLEETFGPHILTPAGEDALRGLRLAALVRRMEDDVLEIAGDGQGSGQVALLLDLKHWLQLQEAARVTLGLCVGCNLPLDRDEAAASDRCPECLAAKGEP